LEHFLIYFLDMVCVFFYRPYMVDASYGLFHHHRVVIVDLFDGCQSMVSDTVIPQELPSFGETFLNEKSHSHYLCPGWPA